MMTPKGIASLGGVGVTCGPWVTEAAPVPVKVWRGLVHENRLLRASAGVVVERRADGLYARCVEGVGWVEVMEDCCREPSRLVEF